VDVHSARDRTPRADVVVNAERIGGLPVKLDDDFDALKIRAPELISIKGPSGDMLHGALLRPRTLAPGERHPAVVVVYGGPNHQSVTNQWSPRLLWQHLADRGFFVFQLDNRGSDGRAVAFEHAIHRRLGEVELEDQLAGAAWLASIPEVAPARLGIYGHSYGGFMATLAMLRAPGRFSVGVAGSPVTDWRLYDSAYTERFMETPASNPDGYAGADLANFAAGLAGRLLIVHANMDENVHYANVAKIVDALVAADKPFDLFAFPSERHGYRGKAARTYAFEHVARYFAAHL
jgi:dipeptidyl-peptidase-4